MVITLFNNVKLIQNYLTAETVEARKQAYYDIMFRERSYATNSSLDLNPFNLVYRADEKEEYYADLAGGIIELGLAYFTGGASRVLRRAELLLQELID